MRVQDNRDRRATYRRRMKPALDAAAGTVELDLGHAYSTEIGARLRDASGPTRSGGFSVQFDVSPPCAYSWRALAAFAARLTLGAARRLKDDVWQLGAGDGGPQNP